MSDIRPEPIKSNWLRIVLIGVVAFILTGVLLSLGSWQIQRLYWKHDLISRVEQNINAEPIAAPTLAEWNSANKKAQEYRAVQVSGHYLNDREIHVGALTENGSGYWILTPFQRDNGEITFINRGYVDPKKRFSESRGSGQIEGETIVTGLLRLTEPKGFFLRQNDPDNNIWYARDIEAFASRLTLNNVPDYFIDADAQQNRADRPKGGMTVVKFADNHLAYAITWFVLAIMVMAMAVYIIRYERRREHEL